MGRYYYGDIEGKFWFGVQSSFAADRFGVSVYEEDREDDELDEDGEPYTWISYWYQFDSHHIPDVLEELHSIECTLGPIFQDMKTITNYDYSLFTHAQQIEFADYLLGCKILDCLQRTGSCFFEVEA